MGDFCKSNFDYIKNPNDYIKNPKTPLLTQ